MQGQDRGRKYNSSENHGEHIESVFVVALDRCNPTRDAESKQQHESQDGARCGADRSDLALIASASSSLPHSLHAGDLRNFAVYKAFASAGCAFHLNQNIEPATR